MSKLINIPEISNEKTVTVNFYSSNELYSKNKKNVDKLYKSNVIYSVKCTCDKFCIGKSNQSLINNTEMIPEGNLRIVDFQNPTDLKIHFYNCIAYYFKILLLQSFVFYF